MVALSKLLIATLVGFFSNLVDLDASADYHVEDKNIQKMEHLSQLTCDESFSPLSEVKIVES